jgi:predicted enzyme related to lactoylglutathione lyase
MPHFNGKFVWYDLSSPDIAGAQDFYGQVLGWRGQPVPEQSYTLLLADQIPVPG